MATVFSNMSPTRAAYTAFCQGLPDDFTTDKKLTVEQSQQLFENVSKAAIEANDWLRKHKPAEAYNPPI